MSPPRPRRKRPEYRIPLDTPPKAAWQSRFAVDKKIAAAITRPRKCPGGGIGRRAGFRCQWPLGRGSSSLLLGTIFYASRQACQGHAPPAGRRRGAGPQSRPCPRTFARYGKALSLAAACGGCVICLTASVPGARASGGAAQERRAAVAALPANLYQIRQGSFAGGFLRGLSVARESFAPAAGAPSRRFFLPCAATAVFCFPSRHCRRIVRAPFFNTD